MANSLISTVVHDGERNVMIEVTGILDTSDLTSTAITTISGLNPVPVKLRIDKIQFAIEDVLSCMLWWNATTPVLIVPLAGRSKFEYEWMGGRNNPEPAGFDGNIMITTAGWVGVKHFSIILDCVKQFA